MMLIRINKNVLTIILIFNFFKMFSQDILLNVQVDTIIGGIPTSFNNLFRYNPFNNEGNYVCQTNVFVSHSAVFPMIYTDELNSIFSLPDIWWYTIDNCLIKRKYKVLNGVPINVASGGNVDRYGNVFLIGQEGLYQVYPQPFSIRKIANMNIAAAACQTEFGSTYNNGKVYWISDFKAISTDPSQYYIVQADTATLDQPRLLSGPYPNTLAFSAISMVHVSCGIDKLIIISVFNDVYEIDLISGQMTMINTVPIYGNVHVRGAAPYWQFDPRDCDVFIDLDIDGDSGDKQNGFISEFDCTNEEAILADRDVNIFSDYGILDSIKIEILNPLDGSNENLLLKNSHGLKTKTDLNTLNIYFDKFTNNDSFKLAIQDLRYINLSCVQTLGDRDILFVVYKNNITDSAICYLKLKKQQAFAGRDTIMELCELSPPISLFQSLGLCYHLGGKWNRQTQVPLIFNPKVDKVGDYQYIVGDTICGFDTATITFQVIKQPNLIVDNNITLCIGQTYKISLPSGNYLWQDGSIDSIYTIRQGGIYWVETINGICNVRDSIEVKYNTSPTIEKINLICPNDSIVYKNKIYRSGEIIHDTISSLTTCDTIVEIRIKEFTISSINFSTDTIICKDEVVNLGATTTFQSYKWSTGEDKSNIQVGSGTYTLTVTDVNGCNVNSSITIKESPPIQYSTIPMDPLCPEDKGSIEITNLQGGTAPLEYYLNGKKISLSALDNLNAGLYIFKAIDSENCEVSDTIQILDAAVFDVSIKELIELAEGESYSLSFANHNPKISSIQVLPNSDVVIQNGIELKFSPKEDITYTLTFTDEHGCELIKTITFTIKRNEGFYAPTAFSPNGDNINDVWQPIYGNVYTLVSASIYDRWGEQVYYTNNPSVEWNGTYKSQQCNPGVYVYLIELRHRDGSVKKFSGDVGLIR